ncbi:MAG TPA: PD-(D/E)XK nuclease family protein [Clostridia bacterium]|nr:PD-(D/E)XK nuclease family protein [Clostridia bacterium]
MAFNPKAVFISPSSIADFEKCPQLYYYRSVYRSPRGLRLQLTSPALALGSAIHDVLDQFLKLSLEEKTKNELNRIFDWAWQGIAGEKGGFTSSQEEKETKNRGLQILERFWQQPRFRKVEPVKLPSFPKVDLGEDLILTGKLDWVEKEGDTYHIIDFKTGKNEEREDSLQLPIYATLVSKLFKTDKIRTSYWYLDKGEEITSFPETDLEQTFKDLQQKGEIIKMVRQTQSFRCQSGQETCWACRDIHAIAQGKGKLVHVDPVNRKQEIYVLFPEAAEAEPATDQLPF